MKPPHKKAIQAAARGGYFSRGLVYAIIAFFAVLASVGAGSNKDTKGALSTLLQQPFGTVLVIALVLGLFGFVIWRLIQALGDADHHGHDPKGLVIRLALFTSALTYGTLALYAMRLAGVPGLGGGGGDSGSFGGEIIATIGSRNLAIVFALTFLGIAVAHWWKAFRGNYQDHFDLSEVPTVPLKIVAVAGLTARGIVFLVLSAMLWLGAAKAPEDGGDVPGVKDALEYVQDLPFGRFLLFGLGVGLFLFSAYSFFEARWRRVNVRAL